MGWAREIISADPERREVLMERMRTRLESTLAGLAARRERLRAAAKAGAAAAAEGWGEESEGWVRDRAAQLLRLRDVLADKAATSPAGRATPAQAARLRELRTQLADVQRMLQTATGSASANKPRDAAASKTRAIGLKLLRDELDSLRKELQATLAGLAAEAGERGQPPRPPTA